MQPAQAYRNVEVAVGENWLSSWVNLKVVLNAKLYEDEAGGPGPMQFRIEGLTTIPAAIPTADPGM